MTGFIYSCVSGIPLFTCQGVMTSKNRNVLPPGYQEATERGQYSADVGLFFPISFACAKFVIVPFFQMDKMLSRLVVGYLAEQWPEYSLEFIEKHWCYGDMLFVCIAPGNKIVGTVAVDRKRFFPFISTVYVVPGYRMKGWARLLVDFGEVYVKHTGFKESRLWCDEKLVGMYTKMGYSFEKVEDGHHILVKSF